MDKLNYLRKAFSHTIGKTFENYVINQIWAKVEQFGLYPITQQYVKRKNGYALIDLYFPQINFAIEVNEHYHKNVIASDKMRMEDIFSSIPEIDIEPIIEDNYESVKKQINGIVNKIERKVNKLGAFAWEENWQEKEYEEKLSLARKNKKLRVSDFISFKRIQVTNDIFNMNYTEGYLQFGKSYFIISPNERLWFPHLTPNKEWKNTVSDDWGIIKQEYIGDKDIASLKHDNNVYQVYTFAKYKNALGETSYRFIGVFEKIKKEAGVTIHKRISDEMKLNIV